MSVIGLHLLDAALAVASDGSLLTSSPSVVHADPARVAMMGRSASDIARFAPQRVSSDHWATIAREGGRASVAAIAVARSELRARIDDTQRESSLQCAVSAALSTESLGVILALARREGIRIGGFHDAAALAAASVGLTGTTLVLEFGLAHVVATRVEHVDDQLLRRAAVVRRGAGLLALRQAWLRMVSEAMVLRTRFDPLHEAASEQRLYDLLDDAAARAATVGSTDIELPTVRDPVRVSLSRDQFTEAAADVYREVLAALHELRPAGSRVNILLDDTAVRLPGLLHRLAELRGCRFYSRSSSLIARAASLVSAQVEDDGGVTLQRGYPAGVPLEAALELDLSTLANFVDTAPTHALWEGRAFVLPQSGALEIGRDPALSGIRVGEGYAGVSRLHCSLRAEGGTVTLIPHSAQDTWLNDERVPGRVRVQSGDRLRLGTPGVSIELIAVGGAGHGTPRR
ncbi:MAG: FHA domain-containing protein [Gammaproteobacteria bacterium]|nr:FHA domain-containing protein [Gammaproteobacteria bacterium]